MLAGFFFSGQFSMSVARGYKSGGVLENSRLAGRIYFTCSVACHKITIGVQSPTILSHNLKNNIQVTIGTLL